MNKAIKTDWKTLDMPEKTASFSIDISLTEGEFSALQNGCLLYTSHVRGSPGYDIKRR